MSAFPSPYRGYHLSTNASRFKDFVAIGFRPLIGVIIFQHTDVIGRFVPGSFRFRPLIGVIIFQLVVLDIQILSLDTFPSPYRGYHLSTIAFCANSMCCTPVSVPLSGLSSFNANEPDGSGWVGDWFPSPYRGYHLSTFYGRLLKLYRLFVSVPLSGLSSFNYDLH